MMTGTSNLQVYVSSDLGQVSALLRAPQDAWLLYVLAHGAGAGMRHRFLESVSAALADRGIATLRYQFPYMEAGGRRPDPPRVLQATVRSAIAKAAEVAPGLPLIAGGKSLGGRMTSAAAAATPIPGVRGLVFLGFPLHPPGQPGTSRADHLDRVDIPMLFLQGTRDEFARLDLITDVCEGLEPNATLHLVDEGDHSFGVLKRSGRTPAEVLSEITGTIEQWSRALVAGPVRA
jgi:predicted alpha/beta-hydrolase family hydrolase